MTTFLPPKAQLLRGVTSYRSMAPCVLEALSLMGGEVCELRLLPEARQNISTLSLNFFSLCEFFLVNSLTRADRASGSGTLDARTLLMLMSVAEALASDFGIRTIRFNPPASFPSL